MRDTMLCQVCGEKAEALEIEAYNGHCEVCEDFRVSLEIAEGKAGMEGKFIDPDEDDRVEDPWP